MQVNPKKLLLKSIQDWVSGYKKVSANRKVLGIMPVMCSWWLSCEIDVISCKMVAAG